MRYKSYAIKFTPTGEQLVGFSIHGEGNGNPLQYSCLENPMDGKAWWAAVHRVAKNQTRLSNFTFTFHFHALAKEMATLSSTLAWRIPGTEAWWAAVYGVRQSWTRLKWLSSRGSSLTSEPMLLTTCFIDCCKNENICLLLKSHDAFHCPSC